MNRIREFGAVAAATVFPVSAKSQEILHAALHQPLDWEHFFAVTQKQRVGGLVYHSISRLPCGSVPEGVLLRLQKTAKKIAFNSLRMTDQASRLVQRLEDVGIPSAVLKGSSLDVLAYGQFGIRQSKDIDLFIGKEHVEVADALLPQLGFARIVPPASWSKEDLHTFRQHRSHYEYAETTTGLQVELHWRLANNQHFGQQYLSPDNWQTVDLGGGRRLQTLGRIELAEYLCIHGASHAWCRLKWLADLAAIRRQDDELDAALIAKAEQNGTSRAVGQALMLCRDLYGLPLPRSAESGTTVRLLAYLALKAMLTGNGAGELAEHRAVNTLVHASHFLLSAKPQYLVTELRNEIFTPPAWTNVEITSGRRLLHGLRTALLATMKKLSSFSQSKS